MKYKAFVLLTVLSLVAALVGITSPVKAAAYGTNFTTSITYQNVGADVATISLEFFPEANGTAINISLADLPVNAGASLFVGSVTQVSSGFKGSAVMSSDQPLAATLVQLAPSTSDVKNRPLSNSFSSGSGSVLVPTVLKNFFGSNSIVSIQNVDTVGADLKVEYIPVAGLTVIENVANVPVGSAKYFDLGTKASLGGNFNGSMKITAVKTGTSTPGAVVATSLELSIASTPAYAFEGATEFGTTVYMPSALCNYTAGRQNSSYAVQNTGLANVNVTVTYSNGHAEPVKTIAPGAKFSYPGCGVSGVLNPTNFIGSATITATGNITAVGKVFGGGLSTAFLGFTSGATKIALPYVRWTTANWNNGTRQRAFIAIQNVGPTTLAAGAVVVNYYNNVGTLVGSHALGELTAGAKTNSNASLIGAAGNEFGYYGALIGGGAQVVGPAGSQLAVVVRVSTLYSGSTLGEDYTGIPIN